MTILLKFFLERDDGRIPQRCPHSGETSPQSFFFAARPMTDIFPEEIKKMRELGAKCS